MAAGIQYDKAGINANAGSIALDVHRSLAKVAAFKAFLDAVPDLTLTGTYGFLQADVDILRSALGDLNQLVTLYQGGATLGVAKDFRTFIKLIWGFGI